MKIIYTDWRGNKFPMILPVIARHFSYKSGFGDPNWEFGFRSNLNPAYGFGQYGLVVQNVSGISPFISHWFWIGPVSEIFQKVDALNGTTPWNGTTGGLFWNIYVRPKWQFAQQDD